MIRFQLALAATLAAAVMTGRTATAQTWTGAVSTDWNTAGNWNPATVPNSATAAVTFVGPGPRTVNISSSVQVQSLTFDTVTDFGYTLGSSSNATLTVSAINATGSAIGDTINLAGVTTGSLLFPVGVPATITSDGGLTIGPNTVIGAVGSGTQATLQFGGAGDTTFSGSFATSGNVVNHGLRKVGAGTLDYAGDGSALTGSLQLAGGTLFLDYSLNTASKSGSGSPLLFGGVLVFVPNAGTPVTQSFPGGLGTFLNAGHTDVQVVAVGAATNITFAAGAFNRSIGATADFSLATGASTLNITTGPGQGTTNGLLGSGAAYATVGGGATWATKSGNTVVGLTSYGANTFASGTNTDVTASAAVGSVTTNSLRFNTPGLTLTLTGTLTLQSGGVLVTPSANSATTTITGGTLSVPSGNDMCVHQYSRALTISSALVSPTGLTKTGGDFCALLLTGNNSGLTGPVNINRGDLAVTTTAAVNSASQIGFNDNHSVSVDQLFTVGLGDNTNGAITPPIGLSASGLVLSTGNGVDSRITLSGVISSASGTNTPIQINGLSGNSNTSGFNFTNANTFVGNVTLTLGFLGITADASLGDPSNSLTLNVNDTSNGGLVFLNGGVTIARPVTVNFPTRMISNGSDSNTISGPITGTAGIFKDGTGTLTLTNPLNTAVNGGVTVNAGTLSLASGVGYSLGGLSLNGGTLRVPNGAGQVYQVSQINTTAAGGNIDFTGAGADQLSLLSGATVGVNGNSTWLDPANGSALVNATGGDVPITIPVGVMLTNGFPLQTSTASGFRLTGGGTLFENTDPTNLGQMNAPVTVVQSQFRVTDASGNGGVGNLGTGTFTLDGGTLSYAGSNATTVKAITLTANGGAIQIESAAATLTANGLITGPGGLTKLGPGTLILGNGGNVFSGVTIVQQGVLQVMSDSALGPTSGPINVGGLGTLLYTGTPATSRTFNLNFGTLAAASGATVTLNGAAVVGGFVHGPGTFGVTGGTVLSGVTSSANAVINQSGAGSLLNFTNGGSLTVAAGAATPSTFSTFTNQGSGSIVIAAGSQINASDFETYGTLTLSPGSTAVPTQLANTGTSPLFFNGGSRTFISQVGHASQADAGIDLHGQNAVVAGGLLVNNGFVEDTMGSHQVIADFGSLVKGAGFYQNSVQTVNGGKFQSGNSPGKASFGNFTFGPGGVSNYIFAIDDATGAAGPSPDAAGHVSGWGLVKTVQRLLGETTTSGDFAWTADPAHPLTVHLDTLLNPTTVGSDIAGPMADFDPTKPYAWLAASWIGSYSGPTDPAALNAATAFDTSGFQNLIGGAFGWNLDVADRSLSLTYTSTAVPEPGTMVLTGLGSLGLLMVLRRPSRFHSTIGVRSVEESSPALSPDAPTTGQGPSRSVGMTGFSRHLF
jgi:autotransporter-associated beta strand protein